MREWTVGIGSRKAAAVSVRVPVVSDEDVQRFTFVPREAARQLSQVLPRFEHRDKIEGEIIRGGHGVADTRGCGFDATDLGRRSDDDRVEPRADDRAHVDAFGDDDAVAQDEPRGLLKNGLRGVFDRLLEEALTAAADHHGALALRSPRWPTKRLGGAS
jgi:hypothetical protein